MAIKFSHTDQSHFYLKSHSSLYHKLRRKLWKMGTLYLIFKRAFLFYLIIIILYGIIISNNRKFLTFNLI